MRTPSGHFKLLTRFQFRLADVRCWFFVAAAYDRKRYGTAGAAAGEHPLAAPVRQVGCAAGQAPADGDERAAKKSRHA